MKLETTNLVHLWTVLSANEKKNAQLGQKRSKARNFKFRTEMDGSEH